MYNFRILIQEIQLLRGSFRVYVLIAHGSACPGTSTGTRRLEWWLSAGRSHCVQFSASLWASPQGRTLVKTRTDISFTKLVSQQECYLVGTC